MSSIISEITYNYLKDLVPKFTPRKYRCEGDFIVATSENLELIYLNPTSSFFIKNCNGKNTIDDIFNIIKKEFEVSDNILMNDICNLIRDLQWKKIIKLYNYKED